MALWFQMFSFLHMAAFKLRKMLSPRTLSLGILQNSAPVKKKGISAIGRLNSTYLLPALTLRLIFLDALWFNHIVYRQANMSFLYGIGKSIKFYTKGFFALTLLMLSATYGVFCSLVMSLVGQRQYAQYSVARVYYALLSFFMGLKIEVDRPELLTKLPALLISNHQSELDIYILGRVFPPKCVITAKNTLKYVPFLGWFMYLSGTFFLVRHNPKKDVSTLNRALAQLKQRKGGLYMFPEGTRSYATKPALLPFKKGAFHLAIEGQIPIIPIVVSNTSNIYSLKLKNFNRGTIKIKVLDPIFTVGLTKDDVPKLCLDTEKKMRKEITKLGMSVLSGGESTKQLTDREEVDETTTLLDH